MAKTKAEDTKTHAVSAPLTCNDVPATVCAELHSGRTASPPAAHATAQTRLPRRFHITRVISSMLCVYLHKHKGARHSTMK